MRGRGQQAARAQARAMRRLEREELERYAHLWRLGLADMYRLAAARLKDRRVLVAAAPEWSPPDVDELLPLDVARGELARRTSSRTAKIVRSAAVEVAGAFVEYDFDAQNVYVERQIARLGALVTRVADDERRRIAVAVGDGWREGLSLDDVAASLRSDAVATLAHARTIARTELTSAVNGGGAAAIVELNELAAEAGDDPIASRKTWVTAGDERVRETHAEADGQTVPLDSAFVVGASRMMFPGDPSGPPEEVVNCRCVVSYE